MSSPEIEAVRFGSQGSMVDAWLYRPAGSIGDVPAVVMAHGFSMTKRDGLEEYASAFADAGFAVLVFDHRFLGESGGEPRQRFRIGDQMADWRAAISFVRHQTGIDASRVVLWGYSFSGGHVTSLLGARRGAPEGVVGGLVLCPFLDGLARVRSSPPGLVAWLLPRAIADVSGRPTTVPVTAPAGQRGAMAQPASTKGS